MLPPDCWEHILRRAFSRSEIPTPNKNHVCVCHVILGSAIAKFKCSQEDLGTYPPPPLRRLWRSFCGYCTRINFSPQNQSVIFRRSKQIAIGKLSGDIWRVNGLSI